MASPTHSAAILDNATFDGGETNGVISGHDIFLWGQNGFGQLARADGKKSHLPVPSRPRSAETEEAKDENQRVRLEPLGLLKLPGSNKKVKATQTLCLGNEVSLIYNRLME